MVYVLVLLGLLFGVIGSSSVVVGKIQGGSVVLELLCALGSFIIVWVIISPSLLYLMDSEWSVLVGGLVHVLGVQWFWNYSGVVSGFDFVGSSLGGSNGLGSIFELGAGGDGVVALDQVVVGAASLGGSALGYLLGFNSVLLLSCSVAYRFVIFSLDVIHSFGLFSFGSKWDAVPGRFVFSSVVRSFLQGSFFGYCYELCGRAHSSMLVGIRFV
jgi:cytochrome c oxidase subunit II